MRRLLRPALRVLWVGTKLGLFVAGAVAVAAFFFWRTVEDDFRRSEVQVPDVVGLDVEEATARLRGMDLLLLVDGRKPSDSVEAGRIFYQEPAASAVTRRHREVKVVLSTGPATAAIPDVRGASPRQAAFALGKATLRLGTQVQVHSARVPAGRIVSQDPAPGAGSPDHREVDVLVSLGPRPRAYVMPDLRGWPLRQVELVLGTGGIRVGEVREQVVPGMDAGVVASQAPLPGSRVTADTVVSVVVARGRARLE